jgi:hypothetical protein
MGRNPEQPVSGVIKLHQSWRFENVCLIFFIFFQALLLSPSGNGRKTLAFRRRLQ